MAEYIVGEESVILGAKFVGVKSLLFTKIILSENKFVGVKSLLFTKIILSENKGEAV